MNTQEIENLYIRSLDEALSTDEKEYLSNFLRDNSVLAIDLLQYKKIRDAALRYEHASFEPYFASKVITKIRNAGVDIDRQIFAFFKKYQLTAIGIVIALLALNAVFADQLNLQSLFGLEDTTNTADEIISFDFYEILNPGI